MGDATVLSAVRYVITLDTDTQLPRDSAREMVGTMAHTLNRPVFDPVRRRVVAGYGILQPRVGVSLPSARRSWFVRLFAGDSGIDPYTRVVSDVYQDLFGEGSFVGKGIYDVDAFEKCCSGFPDNAILSHDLLESAYARSALLSDVELYEDFPSRYAADVSRRHRWIRGDWQIAWLVAAVGAGRRYSLGAEPHLRALLVEDLRQPAAKSRACRDAAAVARSLGAGAVAGYHGNSVRADRGCGRPPAGRHQRPGAKTGGAAAMDALRMAVHGAGKQLTQVLFTLVFLPYDALVSLDAIGRTLLRVYWTKKNLLEWKTSSDAQPQRPFGSPGLLPVDVDRTDLRCRRSAAGALPIHAAADGRTAARPLARVFLTPEFGGPSDAEPAVFSDAAYDFAPGFAAFAAFARPERTSSVSTSA